ncbi:LCP family protein [Clostridium ganghwense]|uniref:LCP family protein n=1 Tax=Clostridium ganghwense TaxID=312089 RepID=A0ABT4CUX2_9CLOT|nr:LCP family protein [Clostridium ganghwense]MCY6371851.1 LCP family protein [Clostridium ganghwense]
MSKKRKRGVLKIILVFITLTLCIAVVGGTYLYDTLSKLSENAELKDHIINNKGSIKEKNREEKIDDSINVLALGVDVGDPTSKKQNDPKRTDTMMLIHYNSAEKLVNVVSIPRDTLIRINKKDAKINAAHAIGGVSYAIDAVEKLLDIKIDYYGKVNYEGFRKIIDSIGGVDMKISRTMNYDDYSQNLHIHFKKGETVHLDGEKAEQFFRWRKNNNGTGLSEGDLGRIENQHLFIEKVVENLKSPKIIPRIPGILMTLPKYCETNMSADEIIKYGYELIIADEVELQTLKGDSQYINGISYFLYDKSLNKEILRELHEERVVKMSGNFDKSAIKIKVLNCTKKTGLAAHFRKQLGQKGYKNISIGNGKASNTTKIQLEGFSNKQINYIKEEFEVKKVEKISDNYGKFDIIVMLGEDYANKKH